MLTQRQFWISVVLGAIFWLAAALFVRFGAESVFTPGSAALIITYIAAFPVVYVALLLGRAVLGMALNEMFVPVVVMTVTALFLDGLAIGFFTTLYGEVPLTVMHGAAWIMWGAAAGILLAALVSRGKWRLVRQ